MYNFVFQGLCFLAAAILGWGLGYILSVILG